MPARAYPGDAGLDLVACERHELGPGQRALVGTGIAVAIPEGHAGLVTPRSGLAASHGITIVNTPGLVDSGYRGELRVILHNTDPSRPFVVEPGMRIAQEEIFGPTTALIPVRDADEAIRVANGVRYGLSSSIFTRDVNKAFGAMRDLTTGITYVNAGTIGAEVHLPFGGMKETGNGHREAGQAALDVFTEWKSIYVDYSGKLQRAQIDTSD